MACCSAAQFVHVGPDEERALARIPVDLLFAAPGLPSGNVLMGYDEQGRCPMLGEAGCTIYEDRPRACRVYDCRLFAATGIVPDEPGRRAVADRVASWRFAVTTDEEQAQWDALHAAAERLVGSPGTAALGSSARAVAALRVHRLFAGPAGVVQPASAALVVALERADS
jgi:Fe-S-cluster containining protein